MGYFNPLLQLPAARKILALPESEEKRLLEQLLREMRVQANDLAELNWARKKAPIAAYWRATSTYARHAAHALRRETALAHAKARGQAAGAECGAGGNAGAGD